MRRHKKKFPLLFKGGIEINTMNDLKKNFDFKKVMGYFQNGKLRTWLDDRFYSDEADAINALKVSDRHAPHKICDILGVNFDDFAEELDDAETVAWRQKRREQIKNFTTDPEIIKDIDNVAFNQDDLEDILSDSRLPQKIYLCNNFFRFPSGILRKQYISYIGIGQVAIKFETAKPVDLSALEISFKNITFTEEEVEVKEEVAEPVEETVEEIEEPAEIESNVMRLVEDKLVMANFLPASAVAQVALRFKARSTIRFDGKTMDTKSVVFLRSRGLVKGQKVVITTEGIDAKEAMDAFLELLEKGVRREYY